MVRTIFEKLHKVNIWNMWLLSVLVSVLLTEAIVFVMGMLLLGKVTYDYIITGFVASLFVASLVAGIIIYFLEGISKSQILLKTIFDTTTEGIMVDNGKGVISLFNLRFTELWQIPPNQLEVGGSNVLLPCILEQLIEPEKYSDKVQHLIENPTNTSFDTVTLKDGRVFEVHSNPLHTNRKHLGRLWRFHEITDSIEHKHTEEKLRLLFDLSPIGFTLYDIEAECFLEVNNVLLEETGYSNSEFLALNYLDLSPEEYKSHDIEYLETLRANGRYGPYEKEYIRKDATRYPVTLNSVLIRDRNNRELIWSIVQNTTERKLADLHIHQLAFYDQLTKLPNRRLLIDLLQQSISSSIRDGQYGAVLLFDLDDFKSINDSKGVETGDLLLIEVAKRVRACIRERDTSSRLGGDKFVIILEKLSTNAKIASVRSKKIAQKILSTLNKPFHLKEQHCHITASLGVVLFVGRKYSVDDLLKYAETTMAHAKTAGSKEIHFYDPVKQHAVDTRAELITELHLALDKKQFQLFYQVQVDSKGRPIGAEVLIRWAHPELGVISPIEFIPLLEETGLILPVGLWVLNTACAQLKAWQGSALTSDLTLAVNISAKQFHMSDIVTDVQCALQQTGVSPSLLKLELTESVVLEDIEDTINKMKCLKAFGVSFSMDDFGTGYSSLQYLKILPLDQVKIDRSFVSEITSDAKDAAIVRTIILMSEALGLNVIAEGVETKDQQTLLDENGCHLYQGYLYSKPVPLNQFEDVLHTMITQSKVS